MVPTNGSFCQKRTSPLTVFMAEYAMEELVAELGSAFLCGNLGLSVTRVPIMHATRPAGSRSSRATADLSSPPLARQRRLRSGYLSKLVREIGCCAQFIQNRSVMTDDTAAFCFLDSVDVVFSFGNTRRNPLAVRTWLSRFQITFC